jgi:biotin synthase
MTYREGRCDANCAFCPQARESTSSSDRLSRISWPDFAYPEVKAEYSVLPSFSRICIQSLNYPNVIDDVLFLVQEIRSVTDTPLSVSIHPLTKSNLQKLRDAGVTNIGIAFDACTQELFDKVKGKSRGSSYRWGLHEKALNDALDVFGIGRVTTHLMIGLGETEAEAVEFLFKMKELGVSVGLFAFTAIRGTALEKGEGPDLGSYRRVQVIRHLLHRDAIEWNDLHFINEEVRLKPPESELREYLSSGVAFQVSGCAGCNRPFYNERPSGTMYNFPCPLSEEEVQISINESGLWP